ncbi:MAG: hypothetical protein Q8Q46_00190 [Candidatus Giovannonibacteria bacterium]|nr:hypothetical protein [Candidatus Giovannonibacteria bacterium]
MKTTKIILILMIIFAGVLIYNTNLPQIQPQQKTSGGFVLPVRWGDLGKKMVSAGVIDAKRFEEIYANRGGLNKETKELLYGENNGNLKVTSENSGIILNLLWALGLGAKNNILESGPMAQYGDVGNFASTGGWTIAKGNAMDHYSRHPFMVLSKEQQALVENVSKNIYRPCCDNPTHFPDCNHGMAMLGLLELLASQGANEKQMYQTALQMNSLWFPEEYSTIARYLALKNQTLSSVEPKEILGRDYSSASGFRKIASLVPQVKSSGGSGCGVDSGQPAAPQQQTGCGI